MIPVTPSTPSELLASACLLVNWELLDGGLVGVDSTRALSRCIRACGIADEATADSAAAQWDGYLEPCTAERLSTLLRALSRAAVDWRGGQPRLREGGAVRLLVRTLDPGPLVALHENLALAEDDDWSWPVLPRLDDGGRLNILDDGSIDTHIHLGGALPPAWYWLVLMSTQVSLDMVAGIPSVHRGHSPKDRWIVEVGRAMQARYQLARYLIEKKRWPCVVAPVVDLSDRLFALDAEPTNSLLALKDAVGRINPSIRDAEIGCGDPLRPPGRFHHAAGERMLIRGITLAMSERPSLEGTDSLARLLIAYLRVRNAFHRVLVHDRGTDGLARFLENFRRRGFLFPKGRRGGRRQRRLRRETLALERARMRETLQAQLTDPFYDQGTAGVDAPRRRIEVRVSAPRGRMALKTFQAWLDGIREHLDPSHQRAGTASIPPHQVGLVVHLLKGSTLKGAEPPEEAAERVLGLLKWRPLLREFVVGIDAAGAERAQPPSRFIRAFDRVEEEMRTFRGGPLEAPLRLGLTFHVGEDPWDLLGGLRHVDEVVRLLFRGRAGRIGHGLALGVVPKEWYGRRHGWTEPPLAEHLVDLVWAWGRSRSLEGPHRAARSWIEDRIFTLLRDQPVREQSPNLEQAWISTGLERPELDRGRDDQQILRDLGLPRGVPNQKVYFQPEGSMFALLWDLQDLMLERLARQGVCIEANPTSNLIIGGFPDFCSLPYVRMVNAGVALSINTDDPGLFLTDLPTEHAQMLAALTAVMSHRDALAWLSARARDGATSSFLGNHVPVGSRAVERLERSFTRRGW